MGNRRYSQFSDRTLGADESRPSPSLGKKKQPKLEAESTAAWPGAPGAKGPDFNRATKFAKVKKAAKEDM